MANEKNGLWLNETDDFTTIGLTLASLDDLGEISFASLPKVGQTLAIDDVLAELEAEKAVSEFKSPMAGTVSEINQVFLQTPEKIDPKNEMAAWLVKIKK